MENTYDIETYIDKLEGELVRICRECGFPVMSAPKAESAPSMLLSSPDIDGHWQKLGGDYIADATVSLIRHEHIEPQSIAAYQVFVASCQEMYRIGAAVELTRLCYKFEKL